MTRFISRPLPRFLYGQIVGVMLIDFACVMVIGPLCERIARSSYFGVTDMDTVVERAVTVGALLRAADTGERQAIILAAPRAGMAFEIMDAARTSGLQEISAWRMPLGGLLQTLFPPNPWPAGVTQRMLDGRPALVLQLERDASLVRLDLAVRHARDYQAAESDEPGGGNGGAGGRGAFVRRARFGRDRRPGAGPEQDARTPSGHARQSGAHAPPRQP